MFKRILVGAGAAVLALSVLSADDMVASNGRDSVRLFDRPCSSETVLALVAPQFHSKLRDAVSTIAGQSFRACWTVQGYMAHLVYEDGDQGLVPLSEFKRMPGV